MKNFLSICSDSKITAICIGKFDGMHLAHQELFKHLNQDTSLILSIIVDGKTRVLTPDKQEFSTLPIYTLKFCEIKEMEIEEFVGLLKAHLPKLQKIVVGYDFRFGKNRAYEGRDLARFFEVCIVEEVRYKGKSVHTEVIIEALLDGEIALANAMLGREYCVRGKVISGQGIGRKELVATINLDVQDYILPQNGVYATCSEIYGVKYKSVSFVGKRLSTDDAFCVETHLLEGEIGEIGEEVKIYFIQKIRDNQKFENLALLKEQIYQDIQEALLLLG